jgi:hypothetical protein
VPIEIAAGRVQRCATRDALDTAIQRATDLIDRQDAAGWFRHCGYQVG